MYETWDDQDGDRVSPPGVSGYVDDDELRLEFGDDLQQLVAPA